MYITKTPILTIQTTFKISNLKKIETDNLRKQIANKPYK